MLQTQLTVGASRGVSMITGALSDHLSLFGLSAKKKKKKTKQNWESVGHFHIHEVSTNLTKKKKIRKLLK